MLKYAIMKENLYKLITIIILLMSMLNSYAYSITYKAEAGSGLFVQYQIALTT